jgi:site-specific recombinase XerD
MNDSRLPIPIAPGERRLTAAEFQNLGDVPPEAEWFANIKNRSTKRAYENAIRDFIRFTGIARPEEFRTVTRAHVIAWRDDLERREIGPDANKRVPEGATIRHRLAALLSLFEYLCDKNAVSHNPVKGVKRPKAESGEGKTPALGDHQARELLASPGEETIKEKRDRAILSTLLFHALRRDELCKLKVKDFNQSRRGVPHLSVSGNGEKTRYLPLHPGTNALIHDYLEAAGHGADENGALFRPIRNNRNGRSRQSHHAKRHLYARPDLFRAARFQDPPPFAAGDGRRQCPRPPGRHRQGAGVARARQHRHHPHLRSPEISARRQSDVRGSLLIGVGARGDDCRHRSRTAPGRARVR